MVREMRQVYEDITGWVREKILPWVVILIFSTIIGLAGKIIAMQKQIEAMDNKIEVAVLKASSQLVEKQMDFIIQNSKDINDLKSCVATNSAKIDILIKKP